MPRKPALPTSDPLAQLRAEVRAELKAEFDAALEAQLSAVQKTFDHKLEVLAADIKASIPPPQQVDINGIIQGVVAVLNPELGPAVQKVFEANSKEFFEKFQTVSKGIQAKTEELRAQQAQAPQVQENGALHNGAGAEPIANAIQGLGQAALGALPQITELIKAVRGGSDANGKVAEMVAREVALMWRGHKVFEQLAAGKLDEAGIYEAFKPPPQKPGA